MNSTPSPKSSLQEFAASKSEALFAAIVEEHGGMVFASALRRTGEHELAEEVTQNVFAILARKAATVANHPSLAGWLFTTTKLESAKAMRSRHRHQRKIAALIEEPNEPEKDSENEFLPQLDEALDQLPKSERDLLLDRFANEVPFRELARQTGRTEAACKMRIKRTLEKLRHFLTARGTTVSVATLGTVLGSELSPALPISLAANLPAQALATATTLKSSNLIFDPVIHFMNSVKSSTVAIAVIALGTIPIVVQHRSNNALRKDLSTLQQKTPPTDSPLSTSNRSESSRSNLTPVARFFANATVPENGDELLAQFLELRNQGNMGAMFKIFIPLTRLDESKINTLLEEVEATEKFPHVKGMAVQILQELSGARDKNPGEAMERTIKNGIAVQNLSQEIADWYDKDPAAALAWFREKTASGELVGTNLRHSPETYLAVGLVRKMIKSDREAALALLDEIDPLNRGKAIAEISQHLAIEGKNTWPVIQRLVSSQTDLDERMETVSGVAGWVYIRHPDEIREFFKGVELSILERSNALAEAASVRRGDEPFQPMTERIAWLQEYAEPDELYEAIKRTAANLSRYNFEEVEQWVATLEQGPVRDAALAGQISRLLESRQFDQAATRTKLITDPARRAATQNRVFKHVDFIDPKAARKLNLPKNSD